MLTLLWDLLRATPHLKESTLDAHTKYYTYTDEGWQPISKARFARLLNSGCFYKHEAACSAQELIYNRKRTGLTSQAL